MVTLLDIKYDSFALVDTAYNRSTVVGVSQYALGRSHTWFRRDFNVVRGNNVIKLILRRFNTI